MKYNNNLRINLFVILSVVGVVSPQSLEAIADANLNFTSLAIKYGMNVQEYDVTTEDNYILKLFRIPGDVTRPVLLVHGILGAADTFILRGNESHCYVLNKAGYDVWAVNLRGSPYSQRHVNLNKANPKIWDFSFHESGYYDLPATIDFILNATGGDSLSAVGHSLGNTVFYVLGASRPEYNVKIKIMVALGPVCYVDNLQPPLNTLINSGPLINEIMLALRQEDVLAEGSILKQSMDTVCKTPFLGYNICGRLIMFMAGNDPEEFGPEIYYNVIGHYPVTTSRRSAVHLLQNAMTETFSYFNYGRRRNKALYGMKIPPKYDLSKVTMNIALFTGRNDKLTPLRNVSRLRKELPNVVENRIMERKKYNHIDHIWGKNISKYLFPYLLNVLNRFNK